MTVLPRTRMMLGPARRKIGYIGGERSRVPAVKVWTRYAVLVMVLVDEDSDEIEKVVLVGGERDIDRERTRSRSATTLAGRTCPTGRSSRAGTACGCSSTSSATPTARTATGTATPGPLMTRTRTVFRAGDAPARVSSNGISAATPRPRTAPSGIPETG
jgi:hypothetical protein